MNEPKVSPAHDSPAPHGDTVSAAFYAYARPLYRYILDKVGDVPLAEDLTSTVFFKALRWVQRDRSTESVRGWLYATARTTIAEYWRGLGQHPLLSLEAAEDVLADQLASAGDHADARARLLPLLWRLSTRERDVLILRYLRGYSTAEIGRTLGVNVAYVRQLHRRALRHAAQSSTEGRTRPMEIPLNALTDDARQVLARAEEEALGFKHDYVGTEVLLLALLHGNSTAARVLAQLGVEDYRIRGGINLILGQGNEVPLEARLVPRVKTVLGYAVEEAQRLGQPLAGPEHLLLGLVREGQGIAAGLLETASVPLEQVREETLRAIAAC